MIFILMFIIKEKLGPYYLNMARLHFAVGATPSRIAANIFIQPSPTAAKRGYVRLVCG